MLGFQSPSPLPVLPVSNRLWDPEQAEQLECSAPSFHLSRDGSVNSTLARLQHLIILIVHCLISRTPLTIHIKLLQAHLHAHLLNAVWNWVEELVFIPNKLIWVYSAQPTGWLFGYMASVTQHMHESSLPTQSSISLLYVPSPLQLSHCIDENIKLHKAVNRTPVETSFKADLLHMGSVIQLIPNIVLLGTFSPCYSSFSTRWDCESRGWG